MIILDGFQTETLIHRGKTTRIYRGLRSHDQQRVVIKLLDKAFPSGEELARFRQEYELMREFNSERIVRAYSLQKYQNSLAMILEDFNGESIEKLLPGWTFDLAEFLRIAVQVTEIISHIHQKNIIHKNINPGNIIWNPSQYLLKMTDFGIAAEAFHVMPEMMNPKIIEGELAYISPEQTGRMNRTVDFYTDFYSLGVTLYEIATKRLPFTSDDPAQLVHSHIARTPIPPCKLNPGLSVIVSDIIMKLMNKTAEQRYKSAFGLKSDLLECLNQFNQRGQIKKFKLAAKDVSSHFQIPQKLYGRENEIKILYDAYGRADKGAKEIILIAGDPGVGKSSLVKEIRKVTSETSSYLIYGKFDQFNQNVPFAAMRQALRELGMQLTAADTTTNAPWKTSLLQSVGKNGRVLLDVIPELELIIGKQPGIPKLPAEDAQNRFNLTFLKFIRTFSANHQLIAILFDDLQWADEASLKLIELIMTDSEMRCMLFVGTYRDNEINKVHPLTSAINHFQTSAFPFTTIFLKNLEKPLINQLLSETLACQQESSGPLAQLCVEKTHGNPFFLIQFLKSLYKDGKIFFNGSRGTWQWNENSVRLTDLTDNVITLVSAKILELPKDTRDVLQVAACIGSKFDLLTLSAILSESLEETAKKLKHALFESIIFPLNEANKFIKIIDQELVSGDSLHIPEHLIPAYQFQHDRIQQSVYSLIPETHAQKMHREIGRHFLKQRRKGGETERIFEIVNHLNMAIGLLDDKNEQLSLARLNLQAGKKAKTTSAFRPAMNYLKTSMTLLPETSWETDYELILAVYSETAEASMLCVDFQYMEKLAESILQHARTLKDKTLIYDLMIQSYYARNDLTKVVDEGLSILKSLGHHFPKNPTTAHIVLKLAKTKLALAGKSVHQLNDLPDATDPHALATTRIMLSMAHAAYGVRPKLNSLLGLHGVCMSVKHGILPESAAGFAGYGMALCGMLNDIDNGLQFGKLALTLNDRDCVKTHRARTLLIVSSLIDHWEKHLQETLPPLLSAYQLGQEIGDFEFATLSAYFYCAHSFFSGKPLDLLSREIAEYSSNIHDFKQETHFYFNEMVRQTVLNFQGNSKDPCRLTGKAYDEDDMMAVHLEKNDTSAIHMLLLYKLMLCYHFENHLDARQHANQLKQYLEGMFSSAYIPLYYFYDALLRLATPGDPGRRARKRNLSTVKGHLKKLKKWAAYAPTNYRHKWTLVEAERLRIAGDDIKAARYYDKAISQAGEQEFLQEEALANELAAKFWLSRENRKFAELYMRKAVHCYNLWNARAKVDLLYKRYPQLINQNHKPTTKNGAGIVPNALHASASLDLNSVIKASQTISGEIDLDQLMKKMMSVVIESAGAQKALLISEYDSKWIIEAAGVVSTDKITTVTEFKTADASIAPLSILQYVGQTGKTIVRDNVAQDPAFKKDTYFTKHQPLSVMCTPIFHQGKLTNILYLENNLTAGAFTSDRLELIQLLSSQAAISLQNASLYFRLRMSEKKYRNIFENAIEGIFQLSVDGRFISANQSMAKILGYDSPETLMAASENMKYHFFSDDAARQQFVTEFNKKGRIVGLEIEGIRNDKQKFWGSLSIKAVYDNKQQIRYYDGSLMDITDKKSKERAEAEREAAKAAEKAKSQFLANMSHEIRTPINAITGMTDMTLKTELSPEQQDYLTKIKAASGSLLTVIDDILNFSKIEAGKLEIEIVKFRLNDVIKKLSHMFAGTLADKQLEFVISVSSDIPDTLFGDPLRIGQILINLISNAIKFTETGEILLNITPVKKDNDSVTLRFFVKDTGIGIAEEHMDKLFESFTQADGSISRKYGGTGLGLTICKNIIELMNGRIWAESKRGCGSTFYFEIDCKYQNFSSRPRVKLDSRQPDSEKSDMQKTDRYTIPQEHTTGQEIRLLLVEDHPINRQIALEKIKDIRLHVDVANNGQQAVELINQRFYDAVLMDIQMPVMDGFAATRIIREDTKNKNLPIIAMTAHCFEESSEKCLQAGMNDFIPKPFETNQLITVLSKYIANDRFNSADDRKETNSDKQKIPLPDLPDTLPGINIKSGLLRLGQKQDLYLRVLNEFYNEYQDIMEKIQRGIKNKNPEFLKRTAHTLKSIAGNIGAQQLQQTAKTLETEVSNGLDALDEKIILNLETDLNQALASIKKITNTNPNT